MLPKNYTKTRRFGSYSNRQCKRSIEECRTLLLKAGIPSAPAAVSSAMPDAASSPDTDAEETCEPTNPCCPACGSLMQCIAAEDRAQAGEFSCTVPAGPCGTPMPDLPCQHLTSARSTRTLQLRRALCCCAASAFQGTADRMTRARFHLQPVEARDNPHHHHHTPAGRRTIPGDKPTGTW